MLTNEISLTITSALAQLLQKSINKMSVSFTNIFVTDFSHFAEVKAKQNVKLCNKTNVHIYIWPPINFCPMITLVCLETRPAKGGGEGAGGTCGGHHCFALQFSFPNKDCSPSRWDLAHSTTKKTSLESSFALSKI